MFLNSDIVNVLDASCPNAGWLDDYAAKIGTVCLHYDETYFGDEEHKRGGQMDFAKAEILDHKGSNIIVAFDAKNENQTMQIVNLYREVAEKMEGSIFAIVAVNVEETKVFLETNNTPCSIVHGTTF